jgi:hypothetical protein
LCACEHQFDGLAFGDASYGPSIAEHDRALPVEEDAILGEESHGSGEYEAFDVASDFGEVFDGLGMGDSVDLLLDDRALVEVGGDEVRGGADEFDATIVGLLVGLGAFEAGQEGVVDVDDAAAELLAQGVAEDLHVAGKDDQIDIALAHDVA